MRLVVFDAFILSCLFVLVAEAHPIKATYKKWALLLATSKGWPFYRHQANILHAYHLLVTNGIPKENIIVLIYDDIANNTKNLEKGVIRNHPYGPNVYKGVPLDYTGKNVNRDVFLAVLTGNKTAVKGIGSGRVIESERRDTIFIDIVGLGAYGYLSFPSGPGLPAGVFINTLNGLQKTRKSKKILIFVETSYAASLVQELPGKNGILAITAGGPREIPRAVYCYRERIICYGGLFGVAWAQHIERMRQLPSGARETLFNQFQYVRTQTVDSHVSLYGHVELGGNKAKEFFGYRLLRKNITGSVIADDDFIQRGRYEIDDDDTEDDDIDFENNDDISDSEHEYELSVANIETLNPETVSELKFDRNEEIDNGHRNPSSADHDELSEITAEEHKIIDETLDNIVDKLLSSDNRIIDSTVAAIDVNHAKQIKSSQHADCYHKSIQSFHQKCFDINENTYSLHHLHKLANLCGLGLDFGTINEAMESVCADNFSFGVVI